MVRVGVNIALSYSIAFRILAVDVLLVLYFHCEVPHWILEPLHEKDVAEGATSEECNHIKIIEAVLSFCRLKHSSMRYLLLLAR